MRYHSFASQQVKDYLVEPYRVAYAQGTLYLFAFVPAYGEMRTFAAQRIQEVTVLEETFDPREASAGVFPDGITRSATSNRACCAMACRQVRRMRSAAASSQLWSTLLSR